MSDRVDRLGSDENNNGHYFINAPLIVGQLKYLTIIVKLLWYTALVEHDFFIIARSSIRLTNERSVPLRHLCLGFATKQINRSGRR